MLLSQDLLGLREGFDSPVQPGCVWFGGTRGEFDVEDMVLDEWFQLRLLYQFIERTEERASRGDVVDHTSHWVSPTLDHHMLYT